MLLDDSFTRLQVCELNICFYTNPKIHLILYHDNRATAQRVRARRHQSSRQAASSPVAP